MHEQETGGAEHQNEKPKLAYVAPQLVRYGTLADLTRGGSRGEDDGEGGS